jgi:hypothetical protein
MPGVRRGGDVVLRHRVHLHRRLQLRFVLAGEQLAVAIEERVADGDAAGRILGTIDVGGNQDAEFLARRVAERVGGNFQADVACRQR